MRELQTALCSRDVERTAGRPTSKYVGSDHSELVLRVGSQTRHRVLGRTDVGHLPYGTTAASGRFIRRLLDVLDHVRRTDRRRRPSSAGRRRRRPDQPDAGRRQLLSDQFDRRSRQR